MCDGSDRNTFDLSTTKKIKPLSTEIYWESLVADVLLADSTGAELSILFKLCLSSSLGF